MDILKPVTTQHHTNPYSDIFHRMQLPGLSEGESNKSVARQEIPHISRCLKVHYDVHNR